MFSCRELSADARSGDFVGSTHCILVTKGPDRAALPISSLPLESDEDVRLDAHARKLVETRAMLRSLAPDLLGGWDN